MLENMKKRQSHWERECKRNQPFSSVMIVSWSVCRAWVCLYNLHSEQISRIKYQFKIIQHTMRLHSTAFYSTAKHIFGSFFVFSSCGRNDVIMKINWSIMTTQRGTAKKTFSYSLWYFVLLTEPRQFNSEQQQKHLDDEEISSMTAIGL